MRSWSTHVPPGHGLSQAQVAALYCTCIITELTCVPAVSLQKTKKLAVHGKGYRLNIFDTAGQERYRTLSTSYYRGAHGVIVVYDISNRKSFLSLDRWIEEARSNASENAVIYLVSYEILGPCEKGYASGRFGSADIHIFVVNRWAANWTRLPRVAHAPCH